MEPRLQVGKGHFGFLGYLGPLPWLFQTEWQAGSRLFGARAHRAGSFLMSSEVLESSPWLFAPILAGQNAASRESSQRARSRNRAPEERTDTHACTRGHLLSRERVADRTGKHTKG